MAGNLASLEDILEKVKCNTSNPLRRKVLEMQAKRRSRSFGMKKRHIRNRICRKSLMKRRTVQRRPRNYEVVKKVKTLKKLIPNCESTRVDNLFMETADYILALKMTVKFMQIMVNVLADSSDESRFD